MKQLIIGLILFILILFFYYFYYVYIYEWKIYNNPILNSDKYNEITLIENKDSLIVTWFLYDPWRSIYNFKYNIDNDVIYISAYWKYDIFWSIKGKNLNINLSQKSYKIFYKNLDGSVIFIKEIN